MTAPPKCPVCRGDLDVRGEGRDQGGTRYYWCLYCDAPRDPAEPEGTTEPSSAEEAPA